MQRRSRGPPQDISEIPLDRETLSALYASQMRLQGHSYRIGNDPVRWAHYKQYLELLLKHAPRRFRVFWVL